MTPVPSHTPTSHDSGARSAGRSVGSSNTTPPSALAAIQVLHDHARHEHDGQRRQAQQPDEEEFEREEINVPPLSPRSRAQGGATAGNDRGQPQSRPNDRPDTHSHPTATAHPPDAPLQPP